ncbi:hypothetical protein LEP48_15715 [Isoptericola sp. NEAU-Y5]|uniref:ABC transporter permease n=1 Tax=Isoptericola luteus TaxID=2879484 RepID=A0ABS7ZJT7_9MICO|nr:ABC transporter permease subunit [Isoptericola sp. NEAU-Y5]MCA5894787.1 hypothetical protein [Isoptericola sp. NEAU-Y5]
MMRLLRVELRRLWARRVTRWAWLGVLLVVVLGGYSAYEMAEPPSEQEITQGRLFYEQELESWESDGEQMTADCLEGAEAAGESAAAWGCDDLEPRLEHYLPPSETFVPAAEDLEMMTGMDEVPGADPAPNAAAVREIQSSVWNWWSGLGAVDDFAPLLLMLVLVVAVSFVTAEINSGSMGMWLTFEPRRQRVYWSKAAAAAVGTLPIVVVGFALVFGASYAAFASFDAVGEMTPRLWAEVGTYTARLAAAGVFVAVVGVALGILLRHAAAVVGGLAALLWCSMIFAYPMGALQRWLPTTNLTAWLHEGTVFTVDRCVPDAGGVYSCTSVDHVVTTAQGGLYMAAVAAVLTFVAVIVFRYRDVN